jgi:hypothetical protein|tara:strand:- start:5159 stop:5815 length:657 start_codon:yes stop_codon:yes gene_type:complete
MTKKTIKIYGQKRCGTNLMERLLVDSGHEVRTNKPEWKHGPISSNIFEDGSVHHVVICIRNPIAWVVSNRKHDVFLRENKVGEERWLTIDEWARRDDDYLRWAALNPDRCHVVDTVALMMHPEKNLQVLRDVGLVSEVVKELPTNKMSMNGFEEQTVFDPSYYAEKKYHLEAHASDWVAAGMALLDYPLLGRAWYDWFSQSAPTWDKDGKYLEQLIDD